MTLEEYQKKASRTIDPFLTTLGMERHALYGMASEVGEIHGIFQKTYQGHTLDYDHVKKELGDLLWFIAEFATSHKMSLDDIAETNIKKLKARYPDGFKAEQSLNRKEGDI